MKAYEWIDKLKAAKVAGTFDTLTAEPEPAPHWWHRFNWQ